MLTKASLGGGEVRLLVTELSPSRFHGFFASTGHPGVLAVVTGALL